MNILGLLTTFLPAIIQAGGIIAEVWPGAATAIGALTGVTPPAQQTSIITLIQEAMNALAAAGVVSFGAPLVIDGQFGQNTFNAINALQAKLGFVPNATVAGIEYAVLAAILPKL